jgi:NAD(P)-dependent dehydrogenase (short-subunit alcohol dehydrogenase family)
MQLRRRSKVLQQQTDVRCRTWHQPANILIQLSHHVAQNATFLACCVLARTIAATLNGRGGLEPQIDDERNRNLQFTNKVVVVTGSSSGIGLALARLFAQAGACVVRADIKPGPSVLLACGTPSRFVQTDVGTEMSMKALVEDVMMLEGAIDLFISNAGIHLEMDALSPDADWQKIIAVSQMSHIWMARYVIPYMLERGRGQILITASASSFLSEIYSVGYAASKYATYGFAEWLAFSYRSSGIFVSVSCPGPVWSTMMEHAQYMHSTAITADAAAAKIIEGLSEGRFLITTHDESREQFSQKAADPDAYVKFLVGFRESAISLQADCTG